MSRIHEMARVARRVVKGLLLASLVPLLLAAVLYVVNVEVPFLRLEWLALPLVGACLVLGAVILFRQFGVRPLTFVVIAMYLPIAYSLLLEMLMSLSFAYFGAP